MDCRRTTLGKLTFCATNSTFRSQKTAEDHQVRRQDFYEG